MPLLPRLHDAALWTTRTHQLPHVTPGPLLPLAEQAASALRASRATVAIFEATSGGLINAALQSAPGASAFTTCGAVTYSSRKGAPVLGGDLSLPQPADADAYVASKQAWTQGLARAKRLETGATWCVAESGACGPTFHFPELSAGFTAVFISGPIERGVLFRSEHAERESNMWAFTKAALDLLAETIALSATANGAPAAAEAAAEGGLAVAGALLLAKDDRYGGVEIEVPAAASSHLSAARFGRELAAALVGWQAQGKRGLWLKVPLECADAVGAAVACGFSYHHAKPEYVLLTRWLPADVHSALPGYAFTQIGVGGVVVNAKGEVLMVQERVAPMPIFQGSWKLPGGLADPSENFADTVAREVLEETGVAAQSEGVVSLRHTHGYRFGQGDIYVLLRLRVAEGQDTLRIDERELAAACWMSRAQIESLVERDTTAPLAGKVSASNLKMINNALDGKLIVGSELVTSRGPVPAMLYTAEP